MEDDQQRKRFLWGVALAWVPAVPVIIGLLNAFVGINNSKATGLAAVAGGFGEMYITLGLAATLICEVWAIAPLRRPPKWSCCASAGSSKCWATPRMAWDCW